jgi:hypothetical protein
LMREFSLFRIASVSASGRSTRISLVNNFNEHPSFFQG